MNVSNPLLLEFIEEGKITADIAEKCEEAANNEEISAISYLIRNEIITTKVISEHYGLPLLDPSYMDFMKYPKEALKTDTINKYGVFPLHISGTKLYIGTYDPSVLQIKDKFMNTPVDAIKVESSMDLEIVLVPRDKIEELIKTSVSGGFSSSLDELDIDDESLENLEIQAAENEEDQMEGAADDAPIVRFVNKIIMDAVRDGVSDIHLEPYENTYRVRYRKDGILKEVVSPPRNIAPQIAARIKVISNLNIAERRLPQDGRFKIKKGKQNIDFRVSVCPTLYGEKIVMRILDPSKVKLELDILGLSKVQKSNFSENIAKPQGMVLVTGPTGSGKTITLYTALSILNTKYRNISTCEDPVEINLNGVNQVNVNQKIGLDFAAVLRSFLRQDPDIIMLGEIRDLETAEIAVKAAQTGHLVLSTLHTNSAAETLNRLVNMGVPSYNLANSLNLIIAQRLARRLCKICKKPADIPKEELIKVGFKEEEIENITVYTNVGCNNCSDGYSGRCGIFEVLNISSDISELIMKGADSLEILKYAQEKEDFKTLLRSGLDKIIEGATTIDEVTRVISE